jgi:hypothetical protein
VALETAFVPTPQVPAHPQGDLVREQPTAYLEGRAVVSGRLPELEARS